MKPLKRVFCWIILLVTIGFRLDMTLSTSEGEDGNVVDAGSLPSG